MAAADCTCEGCGIAFRSRLAPCGAGKYCGLDCYFSYRVPHYPWRDGPVESERMALRRIGRRFRKRSGLSRSCRNCGKQFVRAGKGQPTQYCGHPCRLARVKARDSEYKRGPSTRHLRPCAVCGRPEMAKELCPKHYMRVRATNTTSLVCEWCGSRRAGDGRGYCSVTCKKAGYRANKAKRNALRRAAYIDGDSIDPIAVFDRDGWRCHLCGHKTLKSMRGSAHSKAPELDHIVTLADGGTHTWGNVACACRACNNAKSSRSLGQLGLGFAA